jgi:uncharacterized repeat protein (TIGR01451 family)
MNPLIQIKNPAPVLSRSKASNATFFVCLISLVALATASAQTPPHKRARTEPLEKYDNPPAPPRKIETLPRMISRFGPFTSFQVNVDASGNNIVGDAANEPSIAVDPTDGSKMAMGWRQFDSVLSNFRQAGYGYTTDGGTMWTFPGVLENNVFRSDPVLDSDETGNFFYLSLRETFFDDMWGSLDGGQSWTRLTFGDVTGGDKQWFTIDKTGGIGHGFQYQAWSTQGNNWGGRQFSRSTDGGVAWMSPIFIPNSPTWGTLDVDTNGNLFVGGVANFSSPVWCIRSSNAQDPNVTPSFDQVTTVDLGGSVWFGAPINPGGLAGQIFLAVDRSGTATNNNIYMLASVLPNGASNGTDVMFVRSVNGGLTFSAPLRINDDPVNQDKWHWFGTLAVAPNGRIDVVWLDTRNAANNTDSQLFYSYSTDGGVTWSPNVAVSNAFNPFEGYPNQNKIGDYITVSSDATGGNVAYSATFNFNPTQGEHEEDVYYIRVFPTAIADLSVTKSDSPDPVTAGDNLTYTVTVMNNGPDPATSVIVTDNLPAETTFVSCSSTGGGVCGGSGNNRTVTFASLASGESETITFVTNVNCLVADSTVISNTATVDSSTPDPDPSNNSSTATTTASNPPPTITGAAADPSVLWPPNHRMVNVTVSYEVTDNCPLPPGSCTLSVTSNEPVNGRGDGDTSPDWIVLDDHHVLLRAERAGNGNGRIYTITITCTDSGGNSSSESVTVTVPHDRGRR